MVTVQNLGKFNLAGPASNQADRFKRQVGRNSSIQSHYSSKWERLKFIPKCCTVTSLGAEWGEKETPAFNRLVLLRKGS